MDIMNRDLQGNRREQKGGFWWKIAGAEPMDATPDSSQHEVKFDQNSKNGASSWYLEAGIVWENAEFVGRTPEEEILEQGFVSTERTNERN